MPDKQSETKQQALQTDSKKPPMTVERYNEIKKGLLDPEHQSQEWWHRACTEMLALVREKEGRAGRVRRIAAAVAKATDKRAPVHQGRGFWFASLIELIEMAETPEGCQKPTAEELEAAGENDAIRKERAQRISDAQAAESAKMGLTVAPAPDAALQAENEELKKRIEELEGK